MPRKKNTDVDGTVVSSTGKEKTKSTKRVNAGDILSEAMPVRRKKSDADHPSAGSAKDNKDVSTGSGKKLEKRTDTIASFSPKKAKRVYEDIPLTKDGSFILKRDSCCMWIERVSVNDDGNTVAARVTGYFGKMSFKYLFESFCNKAFRTIDATSAKDYITKMKSIEQQTHEMIDSLLGHLEKSGVKLD